MENLTDKQIKTRWADIKKILKERQLLAYRVEIPLDKWDLLCIRLLLRAK